MSPNHHIQEIKKSLNERKQHHFLCFERSPPVGAPAVEDVGFRFHFGRAWRRPGDSSVAERGLGCICTATWGATWGPVVGGIGCICMATRGQPGRPPVGGAWAAFLNGDPRQPGGGSACGNMWGMLWGFSLSDRPQLVSHLRSISLVFICCFYLFFSHLKDSPWRCTFDFIIRKSGMYIQYRSS